MRVVKLEAIKQKQKTIIKAVLKGFPLSFRPFVSPIRGTLQYLNNKPSVLMLWTVHSHQNRRCDENAPSLIHFQRDHQCVRLWRLLTHLAATFTAVKVQRLKLSLSFQLSVMFFGDLTPSQHSKLLLLSIIYIYIYLFLWVLIWWIREDGGIKYSVMNLQKCPLADPSAPPLLCHLLAHCPWSRTGWQRNYPLGL